MNRLLAAAEFKVLLSVIGFGLFAYPFLLDPGAKHPPRSPLYLFLCWGALVLLLFLVNRQPSADIDR